MRPLNSSRAKADSHTAVYSHISLCCHNYRSLEQNRQQGNFPNNCSSSQSVLLQFGEFNSKYPTGSKLQNSKLNHPLHPYTPTPLHPYTPTPLHPYTPTPLHPYTPTPLHPYTPTPLHPYTPTPLHPYTPTPLHPYTPTPPHP